MVEVGLTDCVPPEAESEYVLPSDPVIVTVVAFVAVTVSVSELPALMLLFCAEIVTVGLDVPVPTVIVVWAEVLPLEFVAVAV